MAATRNRMRDGTSARGSGVAGSKFAQLTEQHELRAVGFSAHEALLCHCAACWGFESGVRYIAKPTISEAPIFLSAGSVVGGAAF